jgi:tRNA pseudouridine38-40 synthase
MERYQIILAYDGASFRGFQRQKGARTVQGEVETALAVLNGQALTIVSAGRTDTGVHASGQVIAFDLDWAHSPEELARAMNALLPEDVAVIAAKIASADFHPRYNAVARTYRYHVYCQADRHPLKDRYAWRVWPAVDLSLLNQAAALLIGTHNFAAFGSPPHPGGNTLRSVSRACWQLEEGGLQFEVTANAFLYHMVRRMVHLQVLAGQYRLSLSEFERSIQSAEAQTPGIAPAHGLVLVEVRYKE